MRNVVILSLIFSPDNVSTAQIMAGLAEDLKKGGCGVKVVSTTPHFHRDPSLEAEQPLRWAFWPFVKKSDYHGVRVYHVPMPDKSIWPPLRLLSWIWFHIVSTFVCLFVGKIDVLIPRGGKGLIRSVTENATVPVIETGAGNCHLYVDESADIDMAIRVAINAKCSRPSVCNAIETLLVHTAIAPKFLPKFYEEAQKYELTLRGCAKTRVLIGADEATEEDYATEYNDYILAIRVVDSVYDAIDHINRYNTGHSEAIITESEDSAEVFLQRVNAAAVYVNASTRFTDGGEFGFGAEIGISTQKLHVRGPMGLAALTTEKYLVRGNGSVR